METSDRPCGRKSSCLAFAVTGKGEARTALLEGTEAGAAGSISKASGVGMKDRQCLIQRTAVYGPVRTVVWEGRSREAPPYPDLYFWSRLAQSRLPAASTMWSLSDSQRTLAGTGAEYIGRE